MSVLGVVQAEVAAVGTYLVMVMGLDLGSLSLLTSQTPEVSLGSHTARKAEQQPEN